MSIAIFVSGPLYSSGLCAQNVRAAVVAADQLMTAGFVPFVPHVNVLAEMMVPRCKEDWIEWDLRWLERCDGLLRIPGKSVHGDLEMRHAERLSIPVFHSLSEVEAYFGKR